MIRPAALLALACCLFACEFVSGCAAPGDPNPRRPVVPAAVADLAAHQSGNAVALKFTLPTQSTKREALAEPPGVEIYRAAIPAGATPDQKTQWRLAYTIPSEKVSSYLQGAQLEFRDPVQSDDFTQTAGSTVAYKVRTRAARPRASEDSNIVTAKIYPPPEAPHDVQVSTTESALVVTWTETVAPPGASSRSYRVYRADVEPGEEGSLQDTASAKLKGPLELVGPSTTTEFSDTHFEFGATYLYTVRSVAQFGDDFAESADSTPVRVAPRDVFPPGVPTGLEIAVIPATGQGPAYIELLWAISPEKDLAGYFVYRSDREDSAGDRVNAEILPSPTFRDMSVQPGRHYFYRVSAVDQASNESPKSSAVQADVP